jgi:flagellar basal body-associated protein FliL
MEKGNFRVVQSIDLQDVKLITNYFKETKNDYYSLLVALIVLVVLMVIGIGIVGYIIVLNSQKQEN